MIDSKDVTIIIPHLAPETKETEFALDQCLESLIETCDINIIIAWNGIGEFGAIQPRLHPKIKNILIQEQGQNKAVNAAVATTNTPWIFITNDDMIYAPGWWEKLTVFPFPCMSSMLVEPRQGAPTFQVFFAGGAGGDFDKEKWLGYAEEHGQYTNQTGFNLPLLIRRDLWDTIGGYDVNYDPWGSNGDSDLEYKIKLAGVQPMQIRNSIVYHFSQTSGTFNPANDSYRFRNYAYFKEKWGFDRTDDGIWEATFEIPTVEQGRVFKPEWEGKYGLR